MIDNQPPDDDAQAAPILPLFRFLTDHNVPDSVGDVLLQLGHDLVRLREVMAVDATDPIVATAAMVDNRILVSWDRDFNQQRFKAPRYAPLSRLMMSGPEPEGAARLEEVFDIVSFALLRGAGQPVAVHVGKSKVQIQA